MSRRSRRTYSPEFKAEAVRLVLDTDVPLSQIAREVGVTAKSLREWVTAARPPSDPPLDERERAELQRLRRENRQLRLERDILKKATAFFARHSE